MRRGRRIWDEQMKIEHKGYEIAYNEGTNEWIIFEHGEKIKIVLSLTKAKEWIDRQQTKKFNRIPVYYDGGYRSADREMFHKGEITSFLEKERWGGGITCWINLGEKKDRYKVSTNSLYAVTPENEKLIEEIHRIRDQQKALKVQEEILEKKLQKVKVPTPEETKEVE